MDPPKFEVGDKVWLLKGINEKNKKRNFLIKISKKISDLT